MEKKGIGKKTFIGVWTAVFAVLLAVIILLTSVLNRYDSVITQFLGSVGGGITATDSEGTDTQYFKLDDDYSTETQDALNKQIADEAVVLLRNEGGKLPITKPDPAVTVFGMAASGGTSSGTGSGESATTGASLVESLKAAGFAVNERVVEHYRNNSTAHGKGTAAGGGGDKGDWSLGKEADFPTGDLAATFADYSDAAILVLNRSGGEGGDLARTMDNHGGAHDESYLQLSPSERATLKGIKDSGAFDMVIVLVNSANAMELGFLDEYGVDACLWYAGLGTNGIASVGEILAGKVNPSGRLVDTYVYDNFSAPAMQNMGDYRFLFDGKLSEYSYINYAESIYVGYRYPAILDEETFDALQRLKAERNTQKNCDRGTDIFQLSVPVKCPLCGCEMHRRYDARIKDGTQRWTCQNSECKKLIAKSDEELLREITELLNMAISAPEMIRIPATTDREPCAEVRKLDNEISRMLEGFNADKDALRKAILRRISAAYRDIPNEIYTAKRLRAVFANAEPLSSFSTDIFNRTVKAIRFHEDGTIGILLTNDQEIGKEGLYGNSDRAAAAKNGTANPSDS